MLSDLIIYNRLSQLGNVHIFQSGQVITLLLCNNYLLCRPMPMKTQLLKFRMWYLSGCTLAAKVEPWISCFCVCLCVVNLPWALNMKGEAMWLGPSVTAGLCGSGAVEKQPGMLWNLHPVGDAAPWSQQPQTLVYTVTILLYPALFCSIMCFK